MTLKKIILLFVFGLSLQSCFVGKLLTVSTAKKEFTVENYAIPPEFGKNKSMILIGILKGSNSYKKFLHKKFKKTYNENYILIDEEELNSENFNNLNKYRYLFSYGEGTSYTSNTTYVLKKFYIYDRLKNKKYISGAEFSFYGKAMEVYLEQLQRKINQE